ncbi:MAG: DKNYY domain-containing protein [Minisyncoccia bacterium]
MKIKKELIASSLLVVIFLVTVFYLSQGSYVKSNNIDSFIYKKDIQIGKDKLNLIVKGVSVPLHNGDLLGSEYYFYTSGTEPNFLKKVESLIPPNYNKETGFDPYFSLKDITGDGVPEILILVERSASNLKIYEILRLENGVFSNITIEGQRDNPAWVDFDKLEYKDEHISLDWHGLSSDYQVGRNYYRLTGNTLVFIKGVVFVVTNDSITKGNGETCDVKVRYSSDNDYSFVDNVPCGSGVFDFEKYFSSTSYDLYRRDENNIYFMDQPVEDADLKTFKLIDENYSKDKNFVYYAFSKIEKADPETFQILSNSYRWAKDKNNVYYSARYVEFADARTFIALNSTFGADSLNLFYEGNVVSGSDPATLQLIKWDYPSYLKDANQVYYDGYQMDFKPIITGADPATFIIVKDHFSKDKNHAYYGTMTITNADPKTFEVIKDSVYSKDSKHVFYEDTIISKADPVTFVLLNDPHSYPTYAKDKNHVYMQASIILDADPATFVIPG